MPQMLAGLSLRVSGLVLILNLGGPVMVLAQDAEHLLDHVDIVSLVAAAQVIRLTRFALAQHQVDTRAMVVDV